MCYWRLWGAPLGVPYITGKLGSPLWVLRFVNNLKNTSRKFLFPAVGAHYRKPQPTKMHPCGAQFHWIHVQNVPSTWGSGNVAEDVVRARGSGIREFAVGAHLVTSEMTPAKSPLTAQMCSEQGRHQWTWQVGWGKAHEASTPQKNHRQRRTAGSERGSLPGRSTPGGCPVKCQPWNHACKSLFRNIYAHTYCACSKNWWKRGLEFEGKQGMIYGRVWREEKEDRN